MYYCIKCQRIHRDTEVEKLLTTAFRDYHAGRINVGYCIAKNIEESAFEAVDRLVAMSRMFQKSTVNQ